MATIRNLAKERLQKDGLSIGLGVRLARTAENANAIAASEKRLGARRRHGKVPGMGGIREDGQRRHYTGMGMRMILAGIEAGMLIQAGQGRTTFMRGCL